MKDQHKTYAAAGLGGAVTDLIVWILDLYHIPITDSAALAMMTVISAVIGYFFHQPAKGEQT